MNPIGSSLVAQSKISRTTACMPFRRDRCKWQNSWAPMATERDYTHRSTVQKLGVGPEQRVEIAGDVGPGLRKDVKEAIGRGLVKSGELDGAIVLVESEDEAKQALLRYRPRLRDTGYLWMITRKRGHEGYLNQMALVPHAKKIGLIDNKTCSIDEERSGIRFVVPRSLRKTAA